MKGKFQPYVDIERPRDMTELLQLIKDKKITPLNANYDFKTWSGGVPTGWVFTEYDTEYTLTYSLAQVDDGMEITFTKAAGTDAVNLMINSADNFTYLANHKYVVVVDYTVTEEQNLTYYSQIMLATEPWDFTRVRCGAGFLYNAFNFTISLNLRTQLPSLITQFPSNKTAPAPACRIEFHSLANCDPLKVVIHSMGLYDVTDFVGEPNFFIPDLKPK